MDGKWPGSKTVEKIDGGDKTEEDGVCLGFEREIQKRILLSQNGYLFSKENAEFWG